MGALGLQIFLQGHHPRWQMTKKGSRHLNCPICTTIPDQADAYWKGGDLIGAPLPPAEAKLEIVGTPFFTDSTSHSHSCLKKCPQCRTFYDWTFQYEFLINGSEDEIFLTRLPDAEGEKRAALAYDLIATAKVKFRQEAISRLETLRKSPDGKGIYGAAHFLHSGQNLGYTLSFAVPTLVEALMRVSALTPQNEYLDSCAGLLYLILHEEIIRDSTTAHKLLAFFEQPATLGKEIKRIQFLISVCKNTLFPKN